MVVSLLERVLVSPDAGATRALGAALAQADSLEAVVCHDASPEGVVEVQDDAFGASHPEAANDGGEGLGENGHCVVGHGLLGMRTGDGIDPALDAKTRRHARDIHEGDEGWGHAGQDEVDALNVEAAGGWKLGGQVGERVKRREMEIGEEDGDGVPTMDRITGIQDVPRLIFRCTIGFRCVRSESWPA